MDQDQLLKGISQIAKEFGIRSSRRSKFTKTEVAFTAEDPKTLDFAALKARIKEVFGEHVVSIKDMYYKNGYFVILANSLSSKGRLQKNLTTQSFHDLWVRFDHFLKEKLGRTREVTLQIDGTGVSLWGLVRRGKRVIVIGFYGTDEKDELISKHAPTFIKYAKEFFGDKLGNAEIVQSVYGPNLEITINMPEQTESLSIEEAIDRLIEGE